MDESIIAFTVKDKDLFGITNQFVAECFMTFRDIVQLNGSREQIHLKLSRPNNTGKWMFEIIVVEVDNFSSKCGVGWREAIEFVKCYVILPDKRCKTFIRVLSIPPLSTPILLK